MTGAAVYIALGLCIVVPLIAVVVSMRGKQRKQDAQMRRLQREIGNRS